MKTLQRDMLMAVILGLILPGLLLNLMVEPKKHQTVTEFTYVDEIDSEEKVDITILVRQEDGDAQEMDMDTYLVGVVLVIFKEVMSQRSLEI